MLPEERTDKQEDPMRIYLIAIGIVAAITVGQAKAEYKEIAVPKGGAIAGRVQVTGELPVLPPQPVFKNQDICGESMPDQR
ncbi:MAG TPA: hypothetical protein VLN59_15560, partial [Burkholderiales bacterium]|nr:hypothetical protein [Burkholderiales bacterium]